MYSEAFKNKISDLYQYYNTTDVEYVSFNSENKSQIEWYMKDNPGIEQNINILSNEYERLLDEYEDLLVSMGFK